MKNKVLLVDDEPDTLRTYADILTSGGYEVTVASSGDEAIGKVDGYRPDVILLDIMMPGTDGIEVARRLSEQPDLKDIPTIMITALTSFPTGAGLEAISNIQRFIYKPCRPRTLLEGVDDVLRRHA